MARSNLNTFRIYEANAIDSPACWSRTFRGCSIAEQRVCRTCPTAPGPSTSAIWPVGKDGHRLVHSHVQLVTRVMLESRWTSSRLRLQRSFRHHRSFKERMDSSRYRVWFVFPAPCSFIAGVIFRHGKIRTASKRRLRFSRHPYVSPTRTTSTSSSPLPIVSGVVWMTENGQRRVNTCAR